MARSRASYYNNGITTIAIPCAEVEKVAQRVVFDHAFLKLVAPRRLHRVASPDVDDEACKHCGYEAPLVNMGLRVVGAG